MSKVKEELKSALRKVQWDLHDFVCANGIERREGPLSGLEFLRDYVSRNKPVILTNCVKEWPALHRWSIDYLNQTLASKKFKVQLTPDGRADAVTSTSTHGTLVSEDGTPVECFVEPHEEEMTFSQFKQLLCDQNSTRVAYLQEQNDNLRRRFSELCADVETGGFAWAQEAFGCEPDAVNLWIGDQKSVTSFHKDHYENIYVVLEGTKVFTLLPPCAVNRLHMGNYLHARYRPDKDGRLQPIISLPHYKVEWSPIDLSQDSEQWYEYNSTDYPPPLRFEVKKGEVLYLPSLWYHYVEQDNQSGEIVVAVNYWYDMQFDGHISYHNLITSLTNVC